VKVNWEQVLTRLRAYPPQVHSILPPCPEERIEAVQRELGVMPGTLVDMLRHFNGARLFDRHGPLVSVFGITSIPPLPPLEWAPDWHIDQFTPAWRSAFKRPGDWVFAVMNYGNKFALAPDGTVKEWDSSERKWRPGMPGLSEWVEWILREGGEFLSAE
jgi:hypothetical protein